MTMRRARLFDGVGEDGQPYFAEDRTRVDDAELRSMLSRFLSGGTFVRRTTFRDIDRLDPTRGKVVPTSTVTDGEWIWNAGLEYYLEVHGIAPEPDFVEYISAKHYHAVKPGESGLRAALEVLQDRARA
ncbi:hypothetical protein [uncultured Friedmanniella sp.]|uniref:hypothetical protein n=1 Tax=uncultured Friedmanniella sp. TaxID=335381 RepID=UPI0035CB1ADE